MHMLGIMAVVGDGRDRKGQHAQAIQQDEDSAGPAGQEPHRGIVLIQDGQRDEHAGKDDGQMRKYTAEFSHSGCFLQIDLCPWGYRAVV